jgi:N-hydroxyarylamine O-acetyltransferase
MLLDINAYLQRIGYHGDRSPTLETLRALHRAHLLSVPFENLNIARGWPILTTEQALFQKIVVGRRGGFCYELNGLFAALLRALGFDVTLLSARVVNAAGEVGPEFDHLTLLVQLEECWLADVGFGDSFVEPLRLDQPEEQVQDSGAYRVTHDGEQWSVLERVAGEWKPQYYFSLQPRRIEDFDAMCRFHQSSPDSPFTRKRVCTRATGSGRVTLSDNRLIVTEHGQRAERQLRGDDEWDAILRDRFGITLPR